MAPGPAPASNGSPVDLLVQGADLVVTGEGFLDEQSFEGKTVGGVVERAGAAGVPVLVIAGEVFDEVTAKLQGGVDAVSLVQRFGDDDARSATVACVEQVVSDRLCG